MTSHRARRSFFSHLERLGADAWEQNLRTGEIFVSASFWRALGYDPAELPLTLQSARRVVRLADVRLAKEEVALHLLSDEPFDLEIRARAATGDIRFLRLRCSAPEMDDEGSPLTVAGLIYDLTEDVEAARVKTEAKAKIGALSKRERQVLQCLVAGAASKNIAYALGLSRRTVEGYRARILEKLRVRSIAELIHIGISATLPPANAAACGMTAKETVHSAA